MAFFGFGLMEVLGASMLGGMGIGATGSAIKDSTKGVGDACKNLKSADANAKSTRDKWTNIARSQGELNAKIVNYQHEMATQTSILQDAIKTYHDIFKKKQFVMDISISIFIFCIILILLFKYFKIINKIRSLFGL